MSTHDASTKPRKLGRGLGSLLGNLAPVQVETGDISASARREDGANHSVSYDTFDGAGQPATFVVSGPAGTRKGAPQRAAAGPEHRPTDGGADEASLPSTAPGVPQAGTGLVMVDVGAIVPSPWQARKHFDAESLARLAESIKSAGVMQPLLVRRGGPGGAAERRYELVAGERRWRAAQMAGVERVPCVVVEVSDEESAEWGLIENVQREDLRPLERAAGLANLATTFGLTQAQVAARVGLERSSVANLLRLLELEEPIRTMIDEGVLSVGHGKALLGAQAGPIRERLAEKAARQGWSVRHVEETVGRLALLAQGKAPWLEPGAAGGDGAAAGVGGEGSEEEIRRAARARMLTELERKLGDALGTKVKIKADRGGGRGRVVVHFYTVAQFDGVLEKLGVKAWEG